MSDTGQEAVQRVSVQRVGIGDDAIAVFEFEGHLRDVMVASLRSAYLATGNYIPGAKTVSSQGAMSLAAVAGSGAGVLGSSLFSSKLYMATANPSTLMSLDGGLGSAVMGPKGIVAHAPFVPVASSLPIVAPILLLQALQTMMIMKQFKQVDQKLDSIRNVLDRLVARIEATHAGELLAASGIVDEVYQQYELEGQFSSDMLMRLSLSERDVRGLAVRFRHLVDGQGITDVKDVVEIQQANYDAHSAMLASFLEVRISFLRVCVDLQENPKSADLSLRTLKARIDSATEFWGQLLKRSQSLKSAIHAAEAKLEDMKWVKRNLPVGEGASTERELVALRTQYTSTMESERDIMEGFHSLIESAKSAREALDAPRGSSSDTATVVSWTDETGGHSFVTDKISLS